jgi:hypothetical protein
LLEDKKESTAPDLRSSMSSSELLCWYAPGEELCWKTFQRCLPFDGGSPWESYSEGWPSAGFFDLSSGTVYLLSQSELPTGGDASLSMLWPTPLADGDRKTMFQQGGTPLGVAARKAEARRLFPTPTATDWKGSTRPEHRRRTLSAEKGICGGRLNHRFVSWLMGFPLDYLDLP